nr:MAG TPA: hypothetical protein [Caudoviricetes sp.]
MNIRLHRTANPKILILCQLNRLSCIGMHLGFSDTSIIPPADYKIVSNRLFYY